MELVQQFDWIFHIMLVILAVMFILCLIRAIIGPRLADRLVAVNMIGTMVIVSIAILSVLMNEGYLADICLIYAMISFLAIVVLTKVYTGVYMKEKDLLSKEKDTKVDLAFAEQMDMQKVSISENKANGREFVSKESEKAVRKDKEDNKKKSRKRGK